MGINSFSKPFMTSNDIIDSIKRKISVPTAQALFTDKDFLAFINEEMFISQVSSVLEFHEEYFVFIQAIPIVPGKQRYAIPTRAIGQKLRDVKWQDTNGNLFDMSRVNPEEKAFYQVNIGTSETISKYYIEGNDLVLLPALTITNALTLFFYYFIRPNQLVPNSRAAIIQSFNNQVTVLNSALAPGDTLTINSQVFTASSTTTSSSTFKIDTNDVTTATNLTQAITLNGLAALSANNGTPSTSTVSLAFGTQADSQTVTTSNATALVIPTNTQLIQFDQVPSTWQDPGTLVTEPLYVAGTTVDFLQTNPGHKTYAIDVPISQNSISGNVISFTLPSLYSPVTAPNARTPLVINAIVGDYICLSNEAIIPQIPPDLHTSLAQRAATMVLAALGDSAGMQASMAKIQENEKKQIGLLDARVEGSPLKISPKKSLLRFQGMSSRRRRL